ncbi:hypothetical protein Hanom_Chr16g01514761 [Helianthus anomalus]
MHFSHVLFFIRACISVSIAYFQFFLPCASFTEPGICSEYREVTNAFALLDKFPLTILATGYFEVLVSLSGEYRFGGTPLLALGGRGYLPVVSAATGSTCSTSSKSGSPCSTSGSACGVGSVVVGSMFSPVVSWL